MQEPMHDGDMNNPVENDALSPGVPADSAHQPDPVEEEEAWGTMPLNIPPDRMELLQFMVSDLQSLPEDINHCLNDASDYASRDWACAALLRIADELSKVTEFFEFSSLLRITNCLRQIAQSLESASNQPLAELILRGRAVASLIEQFSVTLGVGMEIMWPLRTFERRIGLLATGGMLHPDLCAWHQNDVERVLELDGVTVGAEDPPTVESETVEADTAAGPVTYQHAAAPIEESDPTIRVGRRQLNEMSDVLRQLVLTKNQILSEARHPEFVRTETEDHASSRILSRAEEIDRLISTLRLMLNQARMQPIERIFTRYEKLVRDVSNISDRLIDLNLLGGDTVIDKFVLDELAEPLNMIVRAACHSIEKASERGGLGKPERGLVTIKAANQGTKIVIDVTDDGAGFASDQPEIDASMREVLRHDPNQLLEHACDFSPLAGLGPALRSIGAETRIDARQGKGCTVRVSLPIPGAVINAVLVVASGEVFAIPLSTVTEIVPARDIFDEARGFKDMVMIRDRVVAAIALSSRVGLKSTFRRDQIAVVVRAEQGEFALVIDEVLGHQELVVEDLDQQYSADSPFLGATIREDGSVCLIVDVSRLSVPAKHPIKQAA